MSVKAVCINGHWSVRVNWHRRRTTRQVTPNTQARAIEVAEKLRIALEIYGSDALAILDDAKTAALAAAPTVKGYVEQWIAELDKTDLKRSTRESYKYLATRHIIPAFGAFRLDEINYACLKAWVIKNAERYSRDTVRLMVATMRAMMREAVHDGHVATNPVQHLGRFYRLGKRKKTRIDPFTLDELHAIEARCAQRFPEYYGFLLMMSRTGVRIGEATAIQWHDIDERRAQVLIRRNIPHHRQVETVKTQASERRVDLSPKLLEELKRLKRERRAELLKSGRQFRPDEYVFRTAQGTPVHYGNFVKRVWNRIQDLAKVRRRSPHELRHTWASQMLAAGADAAYVAAQLGHSSPAVTLRIYAHWVPGTRRVTTAVLDGKNANEMQMEDGGDAHEQ